MENWNLQLITSVRNRILRTMRMRRAESSPFLLELHTYTCHVEVCSSSSPSSIVLVYEQACSILEDQK